MNFTVEGKIVRIFDKQTGTSQAGKQWEKQDFMLETKEEVPQQIVYTVFGSQKLQNMHAEVGDEVILTFSVQSREWNGRWFTNINGEELNKPVRKKNSGKKKTADPLSDLPF